MKKNVTFVHRTGFSNIETKHDDSFEDVCLSYIAIILTVLTKQLSKFLD